MVPAAPVTDLRRRKIVHEMRVCGVILRVAVWPGPESAPPLLLFNGIGAGIELLAPFAEAIEGRTVICFDVPGTGSSERPRHPYRLWMLAATTANLLDQLGYGDVDVLGVSWGGTLAQQFALQYPRRCRRLVLASTAPGVTMIPPRIGVLLKFMTPRRYNDAEYRAAIAGEIYGGKARHDLSALQHFHRTQWTGYLAQQAALSGWSSIPWLHLIRQPTLVIHGTDDPIVRPRNGRILAALIPKARLHLLDDGHLCLISSADELAPVVAAFLDEADSVRAPERN